MDKKFLKAKDIAQLWGITPRRVNQLCTAGFINGAYKEGRYWLIPSDTTKPEILRNKQNPPLSGRLLPCPVGITSYKEVSKECYYVDKTLLIKDIIDDHSKVYLFTRPRRFGKTLTMDMIRTYFEKTSTDTSIYFSDKKIWDCGDAYKQLQGTYPVIFLSFKDAHQTNWADMYRSLCFTLKEEFLRHIELLSSKAINEYDKKYIHNLINDVADSTDYQFALGKLSSLLATHYNQKVIIIIDEYDTPIQQGHLYHYYNEVVGFMRNLFSSALKDNENLEFGILTGILRIAKESLFSGLNNLVVNTILDDKYSEYFGFTVNDISNMAAYYGMAEKLSEIKEWYDGYLFGNTEIYNPWSVINYFNNNCKPKAFWSRTSGNEIIGELIRSSDKEVYESLSLLLQGKEVQSIINTDIIYPEVNADSDTIYSFLLVAGSLLRDFELALRTGDTTLFTDTLQKYLLQSASTFDTTNENFYHGTVFGMLAILSDRYYISSNRESGEGRFDIQLEPKDKSQLGYIIEFKAGKNLSDTELADSASSAIQQIQSKKYSTDMEYHGIKKIGLFGIAFSGKRVAAKYAEIQLHS